ncbi:HTH-type transcriptional regulator LutR [Acidithrix ferrooxidans]|uniref:HTH-type transcriptional regulator LutR n=2 Tax=Acidimicrobiaceae TaxID=84994 RepID=A0A0D8HDC2_9ACTN|nr:HTH-type transcriptional regulator LutR [Acidithrix ferrooxidans]
MEAVKGPAERDIYMNVSVKTIEKIMGLIANGEFCPGQRPPSENELAAKFGLSRSSLREATSALVQLRVLEVRKGSGTYVSGLGPEVLMSGLGLGVDLAQGDSLIEIFEVRRLFEPVATAYAALKINEEQVSNLRHSLELMYKANNVEELIVIDFDFHEQIMAVTGNMTLCALMRGLSTKALRARIWCGIYLGGVQSFTLEQHRRIVEALAERNPTLASAASTIHVTESERWIRSLIESDQAALHALHEHSSTVKDIQSAEQH